MEENKEKIKPPMPDSIKLLWIAFGIVNVIILIMVLL